MPAWALEMDFRQGKALCRYERPKINGTFARACRPAPWACETEDMANPLYILANADVKAWPLQHHRATSSGVI